MILVVGRTAVRLDKYKGRHTGLPRQKPTEYHLAVSQVLFDF